MAIHYRTDIDLTLHQLLNALLEHIAVLPDTVDNGRLLFEDESSQPYIGQLGVWRQILHATRIDNETLEFTTDLGTITTKVQDVLLHTARLIDPVNELAGFGVGRSPDVALDIAGMEQRFSLNGLTVRRTMGSSSAAAGEPFVQIGPTGVDPVVSWIHLTVIERNDLDSHPLALAVCSGVLVATEAGVALLLHTVQQGRQFSVDLDGRVAWLDTTPLEQIPAQPARVAGLSSTSIIVIEQYTNGTELPISFAP